MALLNYIHNVPKETSSSQKQELLFKEFDINYNKVEARYRKGSVVIRRSVYKHVLYQSLTHLF
jgi:tRNA(His) 5'-end guanylyltransferase